MTASLSEAGASADHLIIPYAASHSPALREALPRLELPHLHAMLQALARVHADADDPQAPGLDMPHERALARAWALAAPTAASGAWPWAALSQGAGAVPQAFFSPCHWQVGMDQVVMHNPADLQLSEAESQALLAAMQPFFSEDGLTARYLAPTQWHVQGELLRGLQCASLDRVVGMNVNPWLPKSDAAKALRRLQSEMQMLLYNHPVNDARSAQGQWTVNSFWVHGAGVLPHPPTGPAPHLALGLREAALSEDAQAWAQAWQALDATVCAEWHSRMRTRPVTLTLCSEFSAHTYQTRALSSLQQLWQRAQRVVQPQTPTKALLAL